MLKEQTVIEIARAKDAQIIGMMSRNDIEQGLGWKYTPERIVKLIHNDLKNVVVARMDSEVVGFGIMTYTAYQANLDLLGVKHELRRMKIGTQIVNWLEEVAIAAGALNIYVQVRSQNSTAVEFYKSLDFQVLEEMRGYYKGIETGLIMAKNLRSMLRFE